jgi:hypothetical protein
MPIPYPPPGCKTAYIQNSRALVVPVGAVLPPICVQCGMPSDVMIKTTFHWPRPDPDLRSYSSRSPWLTPLVQEIGFLFRCIFRLGSRVKLDVPLCAGHRDEEKFWHWLGTVMSVIGLGLIAFNYKHFETVPSRNDPVLFGTLVMLIGGCLLIFEGVNTLGLVEFNTALAAYDGFGVEYMKKMPHEVQIFPSKYGGAAFVSATETGRHETGSARTFSTDLL